MTRKYRRVHRNGKTYNMLHLPGTSFFKFEIVNKYGSHIERLYKEQTGRNVYGISHFIEHLGFKSPKDFTSQELLSLIKNEGTYNASTDYDRINYWFETTMDKIDLGIKLVANYALNTLENVNDEEFFIERKVVYNEAKMYADDDQTMFWFDSTKALTGYDREDNVIGIPKTIETFQKEDCVAIKDIFLQNNNNVYNVTFDSSILTENEVIDKIEAELERHKPLCKTKPVTQEEYDNIVIQPKRITSKVINESEQFMTLINLDVVDNKITALAANEYLLNYAEDTSLNEVIREKNGLTYHVSFGTSNISYTPYTYFGCDVTKGTEDKLMDLFKESINACVENWNEKAFEKYMKTKKLKRSMSLLNQKMYINWHSLTTWNPEIIEEFKEVLEQDLDKAYDVVDDAYLSVESIGNYLRAVQEKVNNEDFGKVTN